MSDRSPRAVAHELGIVENITIMLHDVAELRELVPSWDDLSKAEQMEVTRSVDPESVVRVKNLTTSNLHEYIVDNLHPGIAANETATHLAVGNDDATAPSTGNDDLNNEVYRTAITDSVDNGNELLSSTFLDSTEANGFDLVECGLFTADAGGLLLNHSTFNTISKANTNTATIDVTLRFKNPV